MESQKVTHKGAQSAAGSTQVNNHHTAGAFDIRNIIGALLGLYGVVLLAAYFLLDPGTNPDTGMAKNSIDNLWVGAVLLIAGIVFAAWAKLRPVVVDEN